MKSRAIRFAIPSKGRLHDAALDCLDKASTPVIRIGNHRAYCGEIGQFPQIEVRFLSAGEIVDALHYGEVHVGITGLDLLREDAIRLASSVSEILSLNYGCADVVAAVPEAWLDVVELEDLADVASTFPGFHGRRLRIATKYPNLAMEFLTRANVDQFRLVESLGATEGAPARGKADCIIDITTSGQTLAANQLRVLQNGVLFRSSAVFCVSLTADWASGITSDLTTLIHHIEAEQTAAHTRVCEVFGIRPSLLDQVQKVFDCRILGSVGIDMSDHLTDARLLVPGAQISKLAAVFSASDVAEVIFHPASQVFLSGRAAAHRAERSIAEGIPVRVDPGNPERIPQRI